MTTKLKQLNILSLFDGMSTLQLALHNQGFQVGKYYASEIKPHAIELTQYHFPRTVQLGDINEWREWDIDWESIDFIGSGSPCQDLSVAGKRAGLRGKRSGLFWVFVEILDYARKANPDVLFLQENVYSAKREDVASMSQALGVKPQMINSSLLTAQQRKRWYWTNIKTCRNLFGEKYVCIPEPKDRGVLFKDVIESGYADREKARTLLEGESRPHKNMELLLMRYKTTGFNNVVFTNSEMTKVRLLTQTELERLQGFPDGYTSILPRNKAASLLGDGWTLPIIEHILSELKREK